MTMDNLPRHPPATQSLQWRPLDLHKSPIHPPSSQHGTASHQNLLKNEPDNICLLGALRRKSIVYPVMQSHTHRIKRVTLTRITHLATAVTANTSHPIKRNGAKYTGARETTHSAENTNVANGIRVQAAPVATHATAYSANTHTHPIPWQSQPRSHPSPQAQQPCTHHYKGRTMAHTFTQISEEIQSSQWRTAL